MMGAVSAPILKPFILLFITHHIGSYGTYRNVAIIAENL